MPLKPNLELFAPVHNLFLTAPVSMLSDIIEEAHCLIKKHPLILELIEKDQIEHGKLKKSKRQEDAKWIDSNSGWFSWFKPKNNDPVDPSKLSLEKGRERMPAFMVLVFILIRASYGGIKTKFVQELLLESQSLYVLFYNMRIKRPGLSTILDNINSVSNSTREEILTLHLRSVLAEELDDFKNITFDSTSVKANSAWPTDSSLLVRLAERIYHIGLCVKKYGIPPLPEKDFLFQIKQIKSIAKEIAFTAGKKNKTREVKRLYDKLLKKADKLYNKYTKEVKRIQNLTNKKNLLPSKKRILEGLVETMVADHNDLLKVVIYCRERVFEEKQLNSNKKVLSLSDIDAGYIQKGGREAVIGYKPQLGRSENGFISAIIIPQGNAADSDQFKPLVDDAINRIGVIPKIVSVDDGYTNKKARDEMLEMGIEIVSISGAKGRKLIPIDVYESEVYQKVRDDRSAVESLMFTVKNNHKFDRVMRRGLSNVRAELLEKALAYNISRAILIRERKLAKAA